MNFYGSIFLCIVVLSVQTLAVPTYGLTKEDDDMNAKGQIKLEMEDDKNPSDMPNMRSYQAAKQDPAYGRQYYGAPAPVYNAPAPVYNAPAPAYHAPAPAYHAPAPAYHAPAPAYQAPAPAYHAPAPAYHAPAKPVVYSYPSAAPTMPCPKNLLVSCQPALTPVPCVAPSYSAPAPSYQAPSY